MRQISDLTYAAQTTIVKYENDNWQEILEFVGMERFRLSLGELSIKTRNDQMKVVNEGDFIITFLNDQLEVLTRQEMMQLGLVEPEIEKEEIQDNEEEDEEEDKGDDL